MSEVTYRTREGDVLDAICWRYYRNESSLEKVLAANHGLGDYGPQLPAGLVIILPPIAAPAVTRTVSLWD